MDLNKEGENSVVNSSATRSLNVGSSPSEVEKATLGRLIHEYRDIFREG